ncbi:MAG: hypothetical protein KatS3mg082_2672 [Nitrospiraceae bacterium]|nr:MAG: hypothetical protein KatS3mg082_2672 [Nitrospiraceae bacterium]
MVPTLPYNVNYGADHEGQAPRQEACHRNDNLGHRFEPFLRSACSNILAVTKGAVYICMSSSELHTLHKAFTEAGGHWSTFLIWAKNTFTMGRADYQRQYEPILYGWKEGAEPLLVRRPRPRRRVVRKEAVANDLHPTMKPVELIERAIRNSSKSRDTVLDPFAGSGSTLVACEKTGRLGRMVEMDPKYCDVMCRRYQDFTGKPARLEADGRTFDRVAEIRGVAAA